MEGIRVDGRKSPNDLRHLNCYPDVLNRAHGSARWSQGDTIVLAAVYGPKAGTKKNENPEKASIEVIWKPKTGQMGKEEKECEMILRRTMQSICLLTVNPNTTTSIIIQVVNDDGALIPCAINAASVALVDAGIPLKHLAVAISCGLDKTGSVLLDPTKLEEQAMQAFTYLVFPNSVLSVLPDASLQKEGEKMEHGLITSVNRGVMSVRIGSPPHEFSLLVDTATSLTWVFCNSCYRCPTSNNFGMQLGAYAPYISQSGSTVCCTDRACKVITYSTYLTHDSECRYLFGYANNITTSRHLVSDVIHLDIVMGRSKMRSCLTTIVFRCTTYQWGSLSRVDTSVHGVLSLAPYDISVITQHYVGGVAPKIFSHCFKGGDNGGGKLVLGEIQEPGMVYTPLDTSRPPYCVNMHNIFIGRKVVSIDPVVFASTYVDYGTTLAILAEKANDPFIYYGIRTWCIGFQKVAGRSDTILGDLVLKDKIIVYDQARNQLRWTDYNCSQTINVSMRPHGSASSLLVNSFI